MGCYIGANCSTGPAKGVIEDPCPSGLPEVLTVAHMGTLGRKYLIYGYLDPLDWKEL